MPVTLSQGWIVLSKSVLDICYSEPTKGDDRLAFILGHELSHQLHDDLWHLNFFQQDVLYSNFPPDLLAKMQNEFSKPAHLLAKELRADQHGIIYAAMAGFNPYAIVTEDDRINFFADWISALPLRPSSNQFPLIFQQRVAKLKAHLRHVIDQTAIFQVGLWSYYAGDYPQAIQAFVHFRDFFPGREVVHNLATSHHRLALQIYQAWKPDQRPIPFHLSMEIDSETRASMIYHANRTSRFRNLEEPVPSETLFRNHLDNAIRLYQDALRLDPSYVPSALNLGSTLILRGLQATGVKRQADLAGAIMWLSRALSDQPNNAAILTNLGVALFYEERYNQAKSHLVQARTFSPDYAAPVCNLEHIARIEHREAEARNYQRLCRQLLFPRSTLQPNTDQITMLDSLKFL